MSEPSAPTPEELARQLRDHLESLRSAGVEWLPAAPPPAAPLPDPAPTRRAALTPPPAVPEPATPAFQPLLFGGGGDLASAAPETPAAPAARLHELEVLAGRVAGCLRCPELCSTRTQTVFGVGPLDPPLCFVGEAPGRDEDAQGEPFVGAAGQLLNRIIAACGFKREEVYILNILKCRPPGNRTPLPEEAANCREYLERQLELVRPQFLCALGGTAATNLLGTTLSISRLRGRFFEYRGIPVMCTFHPSYLLRSPERKKDVWEDMKKLLTRMGRPIPRR